MDNLISIALSRYFLQVKPRTREDVGNRGTRNGDNELVKQNGLDSSQNDTLIRIFRLNNWNNMLS